MLAVGSATEHRDPAADLGATLVDPTIAYLTSDGPADGPWVRSYRVEDVLPFERELLDYLRRNTTILDTLREKNVLDDDLVAELGKKTDEFILEFQAGKGQSIGKPGNEAVEAAEADDVNQEKIVKGRR